MDPPPNNSPDLHVGIIGAMQPDLEMKRFRLVPPPVIAALASIAALAFPIWFLSRSGDAGFAPVRFMFSGAAFAERPLVTGGALDQFSLQKEFFIQLYSLVVICPCIAFARWISHYQARAARRVFAIGSLVLLVHPLSVLTILSFDVFRYLMHMGFTPTRLVGLVVALLTYPGLAWFAAWACNRPPR